MCKARENLMNVTVAATQFACCSSSAANTDKAEAMVRTAAAQGAHIILLQELFEAEYEATSRVSL